VFYFSISLGYLTTSKFQQIKRVAGEFVFQQESAPVNCVRNTVLLLQCEILDFFLSCGPPNNQELILINDSESCSSMSMILRVNKIEKIKQRLTEV